MNSIFNGFHKSISSLERTCINNKIMMRNNQFYLQIARKGFYILATIGYLFFSGPKSLSYQKSSSPSLDQDETLKFEVKTFESRTIGKTRKYGVILPPHYQDDLRIRYPVIFMLHGGHGSERDWVDKFGLLPVLGRLYQTKQLPYSIVVTPDGNDLRPFRLGSFDPEYYDGKNGNIDTLIGSELPALLKSQYRTSLDPQLWAMGGLSSGGWGALNVGLRHLNQFNVFFSLIGYFTDKSGPANSPLLTVQSLTKTMLRPIHVYADAGMGDVKHPSFLTSTSEFHQMLDQLKVDNVFYAFPGGHGSSGPDFGSNYVRKHIVDALSFVGKNFQTALKPQQ